MTTPSASAGRTPEPVSPDVADLAGKDMSPGEYARSLGRDLSNFYRVLREGQKCRLHVFDMSTLSDTIVAEFDHISFEAPNWGSDGNALYLNGQGGLWAFPLDSPHEPRRIEYEGVPAALNNDHVLDPRGKAIFISAMDGHIYHGTLEGGSTRRVTEDNLWHFLHAISPDGSTLVFVRIEPTGSPGKLALIAAEGGPITTVDTGAGPVDGPDWSPDGGWIYFNTERWASKPGHAQLARIPSKDPTADKVERLISTDTVDWFPHISPDGHFAVYLQYPAGTEGHPEDLDVELVVVNTADWTAPVARVPVFGGQGTINVNSWSPDSQRFAFVSYPLDPGESTNPAPASP